MMLMTEVANGPIPPHVDEADQVERRDLRFLRYLGTDGLPSRTKQDLGIDCYRVKMDANVDDDSTGMGDWQNGEPILPPHNITEHDIQEAKSCQSFIEVQEKTIIENILQSGSSSSHKKKPLFVRKKKGAKATDTKSKSKS